MTVSNTITSADKVHNTNLRIKDTSPFKTNVTKRFLAWGRGLQLLSAGSPCT